MNNKNSKTNESNKFIYQFTNKLNLKNPNNKNIELVNLIIYINIKSTTKILNRRITTTNLK